MENALLIKGSWTWTLLTSKGVEHISKGGFHTLGTVQVIYVDCP